MSFKRDGDDAAWLNIIQKRRVSELLAAEIPEDEAMLTKNGRLACLVCPYRPVLDNLTMLTVHRSGKKHASYAERFTKEKEKIEILKIVRNYEDSSSGSGHNKAQTSQRSDAECNASHSLVPYTSNYDSRTRRPVQCRKQRLDISEPKISDSTELSSVASPQTNNNCNIGLERLSDGSDIRVGSKRPYSSQSNKTHNHSEDPTSGTKNHFSSDQNVKRLKYDNIKTSNSTNSFQSMNRKERNFDFQDGSASSQYWKRKNLQNAESRIAAELVKGCKNSKHDKVDLNQVAADLSESSKTINKNDASKQFLLNKCRSKSLLNKNVSAAKSSNSSSNTLVNCRNDTVSNLSSSSEVKPSVIGQANVAKHSIGQPDVTKHPIGQPDVAASVIGHHPVKSIEQANRKKLYLQAISSGWKRDRGGEWIKDEEAEFDSDEEAPTVV